MAIQFDEQTVENLHEAYQAYSSTEYDSESFAAATLVCKSLLEASDSDGGGIQLDDEEERKFFANLAKWNADKNFENANLTQFVQDHQAQIDAAAPAPTDNASIQSEGIDYAKLNDETTEDSKQYREKLAEIFKDEKNPKPKVTFKGNIYNVSYKDQEGNKQNISLDLNKNVITIPKDAKPEDFKRAALMVKEAGSEGFDFNKIESEDLKMKCWIASKDKDVGLNTTWTPSDEQIEKYGPQGEAGKDEIARLKEIAAKERPEQPAQQQTEQAIPTARNGAVDPNAVAADRAAQTNGQNAVAGAAAKNATSPLAPPDPTDTDGPRPENTNGATADGERKDTGANAPTQ